MMKFDHTIIPISKARIPNDFFENWDQMIERDRIAYILGRIDICDMNIEEIRKIIEEMQEEMIEDDEE